VTAGGFYHLLFVDTFTLQAEKIWLQRSNLMV